MRLPRGWLWLPPELQANLVGGLQRRTTETRSPREIEIIRHVALGLRNAEVARKLLITEVTVKKHLNGDLSQGRRQGSRRARPLRNQVRSDQCARACSLNRGCGPPGCAEAPTDRVAVMGLAEPPTVWAVEVAAVGPTFHAGDLFWYRDRLNFDDARRRETVVSLARAVLHADLAPRLVNVKRDTDRIPINRP